MLLVGLDFIGITMLIVVCLTINCGVVFEHFRSYN